MIIEGLIFLCVIIFGFRERGSLGLAAIVGLSFYVFFTNKPISTPFLTLGLIILSVIISSSALSASGGVNIVVNIVEKIISKHPSWITLIAPIITFFITVLCGTSYIVLVFLPIVARISIEKGIKPVYPLTGCVVAANHGVLCSPISSPFLAMTHVLTTIDSHYILFMMFISSFAGFLVAILFNFIRQKFDKNVFNPEIFDDSNLNTFSRPNAKKSVIVFIIGVFTVFILGLFPDIRPVSSTDSSVLCAADMQVVVPLVMFSIAGIIVFICNVKVRDILRQRSMEFGFQTIITVLGISWLVNSFIESNKSLLVDSLQHSLNGCNFLFGIILFFSSVFMASQTAAILTILPLGIALNFDPVKILSFVPLVDGLFFIPLTAIFSYAVECDKTGSTKSGRFIFDHSLMIPGFIATFVSWIVLQFIL